MYDDLGSVNMLLMKCGAHNTSFHFLNPFISDYTSSLYSLSMMCREPFFPSCNFKIYFTTSLFSFLFFFSIFLYAGLHLSQHNGWTGSFFTLFTYILFLSHPNLDFLPKLVILLSTSQEDYR